MRRFWMGLTVLLVALWAPLQAAGTVTVTSYNNVYTVAWTSDGSGNVSAHAFTIAPGLLIQAKFVPGTGGTQPSNLYDVALVDSDGVDVLGGAGANLSNSAPVYANELAIATTSPTTSNLQLDIVVSNAGSAKTGRLYLWVQR